MGANGWNVLPENQVPAPPPNDAGDAMYNGYCGPSAHILPFAETPRDLLEYFLPLSFWRHVASESNRYEEQTRDARVDKIYEEQAAAIAKDIQERGTTTRKQKTRSAIAVKVSKFKKIKPHELLV